MWLVKQKFTCSLIKHFCCLWQPKWGLRASYSVFRRLRRQRVLPQNLSFASCSVHPTRDPTMFPNHVSQSFGSFIFWWLATFTMSSSIVFIILLYFILECFVCSCHDLPACLCASIYSQRDLGVFILY